jgi:hypothetical protein
LNVKCKLNKRVIVGGIVGAVVILVFSVGILWGFGSFSGQWGSSTANMVISAFTILITPIAGGFTAALIGKSQPHKAGLIAGLGASLVIFIALLIMMGISGSTLLSGLVIGFIWVAMARIASGWVNR